MKCIVIATLRNEWIYNNGYTVFSGHCWNVLICES